MIFEKILITGCGGDIALALARILRRTGVAGRIIGTDIHYDHPGRQIFDVCEIVSPANSSDYLDHLKGVVNKHEIDAIVPMSEAEIRVLLNTGNIRLLNGVPVISANEEPVRIGLDKLRTIRFLAEHRIPVPWTRIVGEDEPKELPCILKARHGQGGKGLLRVDAELAAYYSTRRKGDLWQELLLPDDQEYTCGLYRTGNRETRMIVFRRRLRGNVTCAAEVVSVPAIEEMLQGVAEALSLEGCINVQLRLTRDGPRIFELNPRFSSTVMFRHKLGFRDFIWSLLEKRGQQIETYTPPKPGIRVYRGAYEHICS